MRSADTCVLASEQLEGERALKFANNACCNPDCLVPLRIGGTCIAAMRVQHGITCPPTTLVLTEFLGWPAPAIKRVSTVHHSASNTLARVLCCKAC